MKNKKDRLQHILEIIRTHKVRCQEDLVRELSNRGFAVTQATLSRDLKSLRVTKIATETGGYLYIVPNSNEVKDSLLTANGGPANPNNSVGFDSLSFSGNIAVIKTRNGYAGGLAYDIDMSRTPEIIGTIAGADTVLLVLREGLSHEDARRVLQRFIPLE